MGLADQEHVRRVGESVVDPFGDVVGVAAARVDAAAGEDAVLVTDGEGLAQSRGCGAAGAADVEDLAGGVVQPRRTDRRRVWVVRVAGSAGRVRIVVTSASHRYWSTVAAVMGSASVPGRWSRPPRPARNSAASTVTSTWGRCWCLEPSAPGVQQVLAGLDQGVGVQPRAAHLPAPGRHDVVAADQLLLRGERPVVEPAVDLLLQHGQQDRGGFLGEVAADLVAVADRDEGELLIVVGGQATARRRRPRRAEMRSCLSFFWTCAIDFSIA